MKSAREVELGPPPAGRGRLARAWYAALWCLCWAASKVWFRFRYRGGPQVPSTGPVMLLANHQSNLDPVLVGIACSRQLRYLAKQSLFFWPLSWLIRSLGAVPLDLSGSALSGMRTTLRLLKQGEAVLVFPEGSRTPDGTLQPLKPGFCPLARRSRATLVPVGLDGAFAALPAQAWFPRPARIALAIGPPIPFDQYESLSDEQLMALVAERIASLQPASASSRRPDQRGGASAC